MQYNSIIQNIAGATLMMSGAQRQEALGYIVPQAEVYSPK
jgi:hypothetical protein